MEHDVSPIGTIAQYVLIEVKRVYLLIVTCV